MTSSLNSPEVRLLKAMSSWGTPTEQVSPRPRSRAPLVEHCTILQAQDLAHQVGAGVGMSEWVVDSVVEGRAIRQRFSLESQPMPWGGGIKFFFVCTCGRRCAKLYRPQGGDLFACRRCHRLLYWQQRYKSCRATKGLASS